MTITVVDEELLSREGLRALLGLKGYRVSVAEKASDASGTIQRFHPNLILLNLAGDGIGAALVRELRSDPAAAKSKILVLGQGPDDEKVAAAMKAGADGFVSRPYDADDLVSKIREMLEG